MDDDTEQHLIALRDATSHALSLLTIAVCSQANAAHIHKSLVSLTSHKAKGVERLAFDLLQRSVEAADYVAKRHAEADAKKAASS